jgi:hypothetical protein
MGARKDYYSTHSPVMMATGMEAVVPAVRGAPGFHGRDVADFFLFFIKKLKINYSKFIFKI